MVLQNLRMVDGTSPPPDTQLKSFLGREAFGRWQKVSRMIEKLYPGVFTPEWLFGGKKHGWLLRYKKSRSFCSMIPEKSRFMLQIVFGAAEREKVAKIKSDLSPRVRKAYDEATTYHDGKWLLLEVDSSEALADIERLLAVKRRPKKRA